MNLKKIINFGIEQFYNILSPPICVSCRIYLNKREILCQECFVKIKPIVSIELEITKTKSMKVFALSFYQEPLRSMIMAKFFSNPAPFKQLAELVWQNSAISNLEFDYLVPVPLHWTRFASRGFNQAYILSYYLSKFSGKPVVDILIRKKMTKFQSLLSKNERDENLKSAFEFKKSVNLEQFQGKKLLIIDDLMTTGSTLKHLGKKLCELEPSSISAFVVCRR
ncbi:hypothetical protein M1446_03450 [Candidatus Dependentiae bacterium]|nr:hypothetical protein [Candidatus Dependentiae bacterium]